MSKDGRLNGRKKGGGCRVNEGGVEIFHQICRCERASGHLAKASGSQAPTTLQVAPKEGQYPIQEGEEASEQEGSRKLLPERINAYPHCPAQPKVLHCYRRRHCKFDPQGRWPGSLVDVRALAAYFTYLAFTAIFVDKQQPPAYRSLL